MTLDHADALAALISRFQRLESTATTRRLKSGAISPAEVAYHGLRARGADPSPENVQNVGVEINRHYGPKSSRPSKEGGILRAARGRDIKKKMRTGTEPKDSEAVRATKFKVGMKYPAAIQIDTVGLNTLAQPHEVLYKPELNRQRVGLREPASDAQNASARSLIRSKGAASANAKKKAAAQTAPTVPPPRMRSAHESVIRFVRTEA